MQKISVTILGALSAKFLVSLKYQSSIVHSKKAFWEKKLEGQGSPKFKWTHNEHNGHEMSAYCENPMQIRSCKLKTYNRKVVTISKSSFWNFRSVRRIYDLKWNYRHAAEFQVWENIGKSGQNSPRPHPPWTRRRGNHTCSCRLQWSYHMEPAQPDVLRLQSGCTTLSTAPAASPPPQLPAFYNNNKNNNNKIE